MPRRALIFDMDGASDLIRQLHEAGWLLAIGSSGPPENVQVAIEMLPAGQLFDATVSGMDVERGKPDPDVFLKAAGKLGLEPDSCLVIEDAPVGVEAARRAGMAVVAVTGTADRAKLSAATLVIDSLRELDIEILTELMDTNRPG